MKKNDYITPRVELLDVSVEGVLCASGDQSFGFDIQDYKPEEGNW